MDSVIRLDIACSPCYSRTCSHHSCLRYLRSEDVLQLAEEQMNGIATAGARSLAGTRPAAVPSSADS